MGRFAVIGLGNFGNHVARALNDLGHDVVVLDKNETLVNAAQEFAVFGLVGEATDRALLESLHVETMDAVFLAIGEAMADSILATLLLKDLGAERIIAMIRSQNHGRILEKVGAHETIFPERDMAVRVASYVSSPTIMNYLELDPQYSIVEVKPFKEFIGKTLAETKIRQQFGVNVIGVKGLKQDSILLNPQANYQVKESDVLIVIGRRNELAQLTKKNDKT